MKTKRGQIGTEYLIIVGFVSFVVISLLVLAFLYSDQLKEKIVFNQAGTFAGKVISSAEFVYYDGEPSKAEITAYLPANVDGIIIESKEMIFNISTASGRSVLSYRSKVPLSGTLTATEGLKRIQLTATSNNVAITEG